jgi:hypothetical protein
MKMNDEQITNFQKLYQKRFGEKISRSEALKRGTDLVRLVETTLYEYDKQKRIHTNT